MNYISKYCHIRNHNIFVDGKPVFTDLDGLGEDWTRKVYKHLHIDYPKFYKMDVLSKYSFLGTEILKANYAGINTYKDDEIALLFSNFHSSADVDRKFESSYHQGDAPSPSLFVYTLPNILIGEIAIRNKWYGENLFFIGEKFDASFYANYCNILLAKSAAACLCGWIDSVNDETDAFLFFVEKKIDKKERPLTQEALNNLYKL